MLHILFNLSYGDCLTFGMVSIREKKVSLLASSCTEHTLKDLLNVLDHNICSFLAHLSIQNSPSSASTSSVSSFALCSLLLLSILLFFVFLLARVEMFRQFVCFWIGFSCLNLKITGSVNHYYCIYNGIV